MIWIIIEILFPALLIALPLSLYRSNRPFMAKFYLRMTASENARKLYVRCMLILILLYHYIYAGGHFGEWGILVSTICVPFCSRSNVRTNGWPDFTRNRSVSFWWHCSHWPFVQYRICTPRQLRLAFFFWLPCSIPLVTCCQNGKMKKPRNNGVRIPEHCPNTTIDIITQCCHE